MTDDFSHLAIMLTCPKQLSFIIATLIVALAMAGGLIFYYRLPESVKKGDVKGIAADQKQQLFESCLAGRLSPEAYIKYKSGDQSVLDENFESVSVCYGVLTR